MDRQLLFLRRLPRVLNLDAENPDLVRSGRRLHVLVVADEGEALEAIGDKLPRDRAVPLSRRDAARLPSWQRAVDDRVLRPHVPLCDLAGVGSVVAVVRSPLILGSLPYGQLLIVGGERGLVVGPVCPGLIPGGQLLLVRVSGGLVVVPVADVGVVSTLSEVAVAVREVVVRGGVRDRRVEDRRHVASPVESTPSGLTHGHRPISVEPHGHVPSADCRPVPGPVAVVRLPAELRFARRVAG